MKKHNKINAKKTAKPVEGQNDLEKKRPEDSHKAKFEQLLDDAVLGIKKK